MKNLAVLPMNSNLAAIPTGPTLKVLPDPETEKVCTSCKERKVISEFYKRKERSSGTGVTSTCKKCQRKHSRIWRSANPEKAKQNNKSWRQKNKEKQRVYLNNWQRANPKRVLGYHRAYKKNNRQKIRTWARRWYAANLKKHKNYAYKKLYNFSEKGYQELLKLQHGKCAICGERSKLKRLAVDHCHDSGKVRGLLCATCNISLGGFEDSPRLLLAALTYLESSR